VSNATQFQLETSGTTATMYLSEELPLDHLVELCEACAALPPQVRTLRLDLHGVHRLGVRMMSTLRVLMREWRATRGGECRLSFSTENLVITYTERDFASTPARRPWRTATADAMTATYL
jgi:ABC-type transporter Mla MlaB component